VEHDHAGTADARRHHAVPPDIGYRAFTRRLGQIVEREGRPRAFGAGRAGWGCVAFRLRGAGPALFPPRSGARSSLLARQSSGGAPLWREYGHERGAVAVQAAVVGVARWLVDLGLAAQVGVHRVHGQAVGLDPAVAAALADGLVDHHALGALGSPAA